MEKQDEFYRKLKIKLNETTEFPSEYMFKFIIPKNKVKAKKIADIFDFTGAIIKTRPSKTGKYESLTVLVQMNNADDIIKKYKEVSNIKDVISL
jgi:hypothetical protein